MESTDCLNDPYVVEWLKKINTPRTVINYKRVFPYFMKYAQDNTPYKTPTEIIESRKAQEKSDDMAERRYWEDVVIKYMHLLEDKEFRKYTITSYLTPVLSYFSQNHYQLKYARNELIGGIRPKGKGKGRALSKEWIPDREDIKVLYRFGESPRDRAVTLMLFQSGTAEIELTHVMIEDFDFFDEIGNWKINTSEPLYWANERSKSQEVFQTCISSECLEEIRIYLQSRGNPKSGHLFVSFRGEPLETRDVNEIVKRIVAKAFNGRAKEWKTKNMRDGFMNALEQAKIPQKIADLMVGHKPSGAKSNYVVSEATIKMNYNDAFKFLSINGHAQQAKKLEEIMNIYSEKEKADTERFRQLTDMITEMRAERQEQKKQIEEQNQTINQLYERMNEFTKEILKKIDEEEKIFSGEIPPPTVEDISNEADEILNEAEKLFPKKKKLDSGN